MILAEVPARDYRRRLAGPGILLRTGPFNVRIRTELDEFALHFRHFYGRFNLVPEPAVADYHVSLTRTGGLHRWWRPQVLFQIDGQSPFLPYPLSHAFPLFEWGLNWSIAMQAHQYLMLHAAAVERCGRVLLLPAWPGCGKSTLCAALVNRGWRLFSDEFGLLRTGDGELVPMPRPLPLKNASIGVIGEFAVDADIGPSFHGTRKGTVAHLNAPDACVAQADIPAPPGWLVFPRYQAGAVLSLETVVKPQAFMKLANNSFNYRLLGLSGFQAATRLVRACDSYLLTYSDLDEAVAVLDRLAES